MFAIGIECNHLAIQPSKHYSNLPTFHYSNLLPLFLKIKKEKTIMHKKIGIIGGMSPESTIEYYSHIVHTYSKRFGNQAYPEIIIYSVSFEPYIHWPGKDAGILSLKVCPKRRRALKKPERK
jgi:hypothetical protein